VVSVTCFELKLLVFQVDVTEISWMMSNGTGEEQRLSGLGFDSPDPITQVLLGGQLWLDEEDILTLQSTPNATVPQSELTILAPGATRAVAIRFLIGPIEQSGRSSLQLLFESPSTQCMLQTTW
jgi:hypothetical protein